jgi:hypothetical protein
MEHQRGRSSMCAHAAVGRAAHAADLCAVARRRLARIGGHLAASGVANHPKVRSLVLVGSAQGVASHVPARPLRPAQELRERWGAPARFNLKVRRVVVAAARRA